MTKYYILLFFTFSLFSSAQGKILFAYDNAGNQTFREIYINNVATSTYKSVKELKKEDLLEIDQISYYPNPVLEELYLNWELVSEKKVVAIQLISISGKILQTFTPNSQQISISFQNYPSGLYLVQFMYNNDESKIIKIIKK